jgi:hypothetical protein
MFPSLLLNVYFLDYISLGSYFSYTHPSSGWRYIHIQILLDFRLNFNQIILDPPSPFEWNVKKKIVWVVVVVRDAFVIAVIVCVFICGIGKEKKKEKFRVG